MNPTKQMYQNAATWTKSRVGKRYATGPKDRVYGAGDPAFAVHTVIDDHTAIDGQVTVRHADGTEFDVDSLLIDSIEGIRPV